MTDIDRPASATNAGNCLVYGANGFTGELIVREAVKQGLRPILAGRNAPAIRALAESLRCDHRIFDLTSPSVIDDALADVTAVLHCAGPFLATARPMVEACFRTGTQYADLSGEVPVMEDLYTLDAEARAAGVAVIPASGFDVLPTDCLALTLKEALPDATHLRLAMAGKAALSRGTWRSTLETIPRCVSIRRDGVLVTVPHAWGAETIRFDDVTHYAMTLPWGDVSSAWKSTGIPHIEVYAATPRMSVALMRLVRGVVCPLLRTRWIMSLLLSGASRFITGPGEKHRQEEVMRLRGDAWNDRGERVTRFMRTPEAYTMTALCAVAVLRALHERRVPPGTWTPAQALGSGLAVTLPGTHWVDASDDGLDP